MGVTDCHVHINPLWEMRPEARALVGQTPADVDRYVREPREFLEYLDRCGVERAVLVNYVSPEVVGYTEKANEFVSDYAREDPQRLIAIGSVLPSHPEPRKEVQRLVERLGIRGIKIHPPHQLFSPNDYVGGRLPGLRAIYEECERLKVPVIFHTGTSVFPRARNRFGQPILVEDVAIDFPELTIVLAHGGRPLWTSEAMFLARRFPNVYLELSSVPPGKIPSYFPGIERLGEKLLFGSDWPGPGVKDIGANLRDFRALPIPTDLVEAALTRNPERVFSRSTRTYNSHPVSARP
ncbi:MAG: amidohydrolase family protein [Thermoplasmata archaeon]|nr:amidohydrolase family protein [Thermoplasmata archaeon]